MATAWTVLTALASIITVSPVVAKSFISQEVVPIDENSRRFVRQVVSFSPSSEPTMTSVNTPPYSEPISTMTSGVPFSESASSPLSSSPPSSSPPAVFAPSSRLSSFSPSTSSSWPSLLTSSSPFPSSQTPPSASPSSLTSPSASPFSQTSPSVSPSSLTSPSPSSSSLTSPSDSPSLGAENSPSQFSFPPSFSSPSLMSLSSASPSSPPLSFPSSSLPTQTISSLSFSSQPLPSFPLLPSLSPFPHQSVSENFPYVPFHLLPMSFQLLSSSFQLLSWSFQLLSSYFQFLLMPSGMSNTHFQSMPSTSSNSSRDYTLESFSSASYTPIPLSSTSLSISPSSPMPSLLPQAITFSSPFWSNDSLVGLELECSTAVKTCLSIGRLFDEVTGQCFPLGDSRPCGGNGTLVLDADALESGRLSAVCLRNDSCGGAIMAYDGRCYEIDAIRSTLCNNSAAILPHPTGLYECECLTNECLWGKMAIQQPIAADRCLLPDFNLPPMGPLRLPCSAEAANCGMFRLYFEGECYSPLSNASCPEGEWLVLDEQADNLTATCAPREPCGPGAQKLNIDGRCHAESEIRDILCPGDSLYALPNGYTQCFNSSFIIFIDEEDGTCEVNVYKSGVQDLNAAIYSGVPICGASNDNECGREVVPLDSAPNLSPE